MRFSKIVQALNIVVGASNAEALKQAAAIEIQSSEPKISDALLRRSLFRFL